MYLSLFAVQDLDRGPERLGVGGTDLHDALAARKPTPFFPGRCSTTLDVQSLPGAEPNCLVGLKSLFIIVNTAIQTTHGPALGSSRIIPDHHLPGWTLLSRVARTMPL